MLGEWERVLGNEWTMGQIAVRASNFLGII